MNYKEFFLTNNRSGWKTREHLLKLKQPEIYSNLKEFININLLNDLPFKQQVWHFVNNEPNKKKCPVCGNSVSFRDSITKGYHEFCSLVCANNSGLLQERASTVMEKKYGVKYFPQHESFIKKIKKTKLERYGDENYNNSNKPLEIKINFKKDANFIDRVNSIHNNKYVYSLVSFKNQKEIISIICPDHGKFKQRVDAHMWGQGCPKCGLISRAKNKTKTKEEFIEEAISLHNNKYDYSKVNYIKSKLKVVIVCPEHGEFEKAPTHHLNGQGCPFCSRDFLNDKFSKTIEDFISDAKLIHGDKYDYSLVKYINNRVNVKIIRSKHGEFEQTPDAHLVGHGCQKCGLGFDKCENEIKGFITSLNINIIENSRKIIPPLELDIYIPSHNLAIELDGLYWHSEEYKDKNYHLNKTELCEKQGIRLIHIFEDEWLYKKDIMKSMVKNILGLTEGKIYARKTEIKEISNEESKVFLDSSHIQGYVSSTNKIGLYYNNELVSIMCFTKRGDIFELVRFCNKVNTSVIGGASKLMSYFIKTYKPTEIISFSDRRWSIGNLYEKLDFKFVYNTKPSYSYIIRNKRYHKFGFRKNKLKNDGYDITNKTEHQIMLERKIYRIYDCGLKKWLFTQ